MAASQDSVNYGEIFKTALEVYVVKKDGSKELFNVQKVVNAFAVHTQYPLSAR